MIPQKSYGCQDGNLEKHGKLPSKCAPKKRFRGNHLCHEWTDKVIMVRGWFKKEAMEHRVWSHSRELQK